MCCDSSWVFFREEGEWSKLEGVLHLAIWLQTLSLLLKLKTRFVIISRIPSLIFAISWGYHSLVAKVTSLVSSRHDRRIKVVIIALPMLLRGLPLPFSLVPSYGKLWNYEVGKKAALRRSNIACHAGILWCFGVVPAWDTFDKILSMRTFDKILRIWSANSLTMRTLDEILWVWSANGS